MNKPELKRYIKGWLQKADNDLVIAQDERSIKKENYVTDGICFHCQQAVEKYLKAYLVYTGLDFGKTHNLEFLLMKCVLVDNDFETVDVGNLTQYGVAVRYPDDFYMPTIEEADEALLLAGQVRDFVHNKVSL